MGEDNIGLIAAGVAFYGLLALFPGIAALIAVSGLVTEPTEILPRLQSLTALLPDAAREIILGQVREVTGGSSGGLGLTALIGLGLALYAASKGTQNLMTGLNVAFDEDETRGFIRLKAVSLALTVFVVVLSLVSVAALTLLPWLADRLGGLPAAETLIGALRWPVLLGLGIVLFSILFRYGPDRKGARWRWLTPGSISACLLWVVGTLCFSIYVENFGSYNETFGTLAGVVILLMWLWLSAFVTLLGALLNAELEARAEGDTTVGTPRPKGERGATKADQVAG
ncbi:YihY/virulence factor BrkB family protein [Kangsaoukella pontilimi]|nr:YihY/virulence factor BrkB family protein [Kangsaoukella pontilimi]